MSKRIIPKDYFKELQNKIVDNSFSIDDNLKENAPLLSKISKSKIYKIPENYFDDVVFKRPQSKEVKLFFGKRLLAFAASFLVLLSISWFAFDKNTSEGVMISEIDEYKYIDFLLDNDIDIDTDVIIALSEEVGFDEEEHKIDFDEITDEEFDDYIESIIDELSIDDLAFINI